MRTFLWRLKTWFFGGGFYGPNGGVVQRVKRLPGALWQTALSSLVWLLRAPGSLFMGGVHFTVFLVREWWGLWGARQLLNLGYALPAIVLAASTAWVVAGYRKISPQLETRYLSAAEAALRDGKYDRSLLLYQRVAALDKNHPATRFQIAVVHDQMGQKALAHQIMTTLADHKGLNFQKAHYWLADQILMRPKDKQSSGDLKAAREHLALAVALNPEDPDTHFRLAQYYVAVGDTSGAINELKLISQVRPEVNLELGILQADAKQYQLAKLSFERARDFFGKQLEREPSNNNARMRLTQASLDLDDFEQAIRILEQGKQYGEPGQFDKSLQVAHLDWFDWLTRNGSNLGKRFQVLSVALQLAPNDPEALGRLVQLIDDPVGDGKDDKETAAKAKGLLEDALASGVTPPTVHLALATRAQSHDDLPKCRQHLEQAFAANPNLTIVANNLAWVLMHEEKPDLDAALNLIDGVIAKSPREAYFHDTRGEVLLKMGRLQEAVAEFEKALSLNPKLPLVHDHLAEVYERLNEPGLVERHRQISAKLQESTAKPSETGKVP
jgi:tetratricopeptide (TPR) repeat protein